jgi:hypothetical protein
MKIPQFFAKTPNYKRFAFRPRFYNPEEEERREREERIRRELETGGKISGENGESADEMSGSGAGYRTRISGSFRTAKKTAKVQSDPSTNMLRLGISMVLVIGLIAFLEFGTIALYGLAFVFVPFYFYLKFRSVSKK